MPRWIGNPPPPGAVEIEPNSVAPWGYRRVRWNTLQAVLRSLPGTPVMCSEDRTDQGGPRCACKRWWRWFVPASAVDAWRAENPPEH